MEPMTLRICHLYPTLLSIAGDRGNLMAIQKRCEWRGLRTTVTEVGVGESADFTACDLVLFHGGQDKEMDVAARDLEGKAASLRNAVEQDVVVLAVCAGYQLLGHYYQPFTGPRLEGVGALDLYTQGGGTRFMNHIAVECDFAPGGPRTLVGFESRSAGLSPAAATTARMAARARATARSTAPTCTDQCCPRTPGSPIT
jgi:lipid II isoglutaminyl synthase (glutamine-hydrolysing)